MSVLQFLAEMTVYPVVIIAFIMLFKTIFKRQLSPKLQYMIWLILVLRLALPFTVDSSVRFFTIPEAAAVSQAEPAGTEGTAAGRAYPDTPHTILEAQTNPSVPAAGVAAPSEPRAMDPTSTVVTTPFLLSGITWQDIVLAVWIAGAMAALLRMAVLALRLRTNIRRTRAETPPWLLRLAADCRKKLGIKRDISIVVQGAVTSPALTAWVRPRILVPLRMLHPGYEEKLRYALLHELTHYRRKDHLICLMLMLLGAAHWFNPIVHLAFRQMRMDMETACDDAVLARMGNGERRGYLYTVVDLFAANGAASPALGMVAQTDKRCAERRIRGMFMRHKAGRGARAASLLLAALLLVACFTTACQPTPETPPVINKSDGALEQALDAIAQPEQAYDAPETVVESFAAKDENVTINVDAQVIVPAVAAFPVTVIAPDDISLDLIEKAAQVLMEGKTLYAPRTAMTKDELMQEILDLQQALANPQNSKSDGLNADDPEIVEQTRRLFEDRINIYQKQYEQAPDEYVRKEAALEFLPAKAYAYPGSYEEDLALWKDSDDKQAQQLIDQYENGQKLVVDADLDDGYYGQITASNYSGSGLRRNTFQFIKGQAYRPYFGPEPSMGEMGLVAAPVPMTADEAADMALQAIGQMGIKDMTLVQLWTVTASRGYAEQGAEGDAIQYTLTFRRTYGGLPVINNAEGGDYVSTEERYGPLYEHEYIRVIIGAGGIEHFYWQNPTRQVNIENTNVPLLPFEQIMDAFRQQMAVEYNLVKLSRYAPENPDYDEFIATIKSGQVNITRIELGLVRLAVPNNPGVYRMVPAWKFYGSEEIVQTAADGVDMLPQSMFPGHEAEYLTLNAVDGSRVDAAMGY